MDDYIKVKVKNAVNRNVQARDEYIQSMYKMSEKLGYSKFEARSTEKQIFGSPASEEEIIALEIEIGCSLPPSYRAFLELYNGWKTIDGSPDFFSIQEILRYKSSKDHSELIENALIRGDDFVNSSIVIGGSKGIPEKYLLNPKKINSENEWEFIEYEKLEYEIYESFLNYLIASEKVYLESVKESDFNLEDYFDPFKD